MNDTTVLALVAESHALDGFIIWLVITGLMFGALVYALVVANRRPPGETTRPDADGSQAPDYGFTDRQRQLLREASRDIARRVRRGEVLWRFEDDDTERRGQL